MPIQQFFSYIMARTS